MLTVCVPVRIGAYPWGTLTAFRAIDPSVAPACASPWARTSLFSMRGRVVGASCPLPAAPADAPGARRGDAVGGGASSPCTRRCPDTDPRAGMGFVTLRPYGPAMALYRRCLLAFLAASASRCCWPWPAARSWRGA